MNPQSPPPHTSPGPSPVATSRLWGGETERAVTNFRISGEPMPAGVIRWLAAIKAAAARANGELGRLDTDLGDAIAAAADLIAAGHHADQFPVDVFQTGSGTSTNMNVNEVISALTGGAAHPNDHVNLGQSSNDVVPSAVQLAALDAIGHRLLPAVHDLATTIRRVAAGHPDVVKPGRTHLMDAVPVLLADELESWATQLDEAAEGVERSRTPLARLPLGGTAVGNGVGAHPDLGDRVRSLLEAAGGAGHPLEVPTSRLARQAAHDALVGASGALVVLATALTKIANDLRWMGSGPTGGLAEIALPVLQKGSSIMPGKVNPVVAEVVVQVAAQVVGNHTTITVAGMQGNFELNVAVPVMARNLLGSIDLLANACRSLADDCVAGIVVDVQRCRDLAARSPALATALNRAVGYELAERIVRESLATGSAIADVAGTLAPEIPADELARLLDVDEVARGPRRTASD